MKKEATLNRKRKQRNGHKNGQAHLNGSNGQYQAQAENTGKGKLDTITFIYGFGAAVVLVGAMFKFLGWPFANELFIVGLSIEAVVFLISAFERKEEEVEYKWENVFPQLQNEERSLNGAANGGSYSSAMEQFAHTLNEVTHNIQGLSQSLSEIRHTMEDSARSSVEMKDQMGEFNDLMDHYNENLKAINDRYDRVMES